MYFRNSDQHSSLEEILYEVLNTMGSPQTMVNNYRSIT